MSPVNTPTQSCRRLRSRRPHRKSKSGCVNCRFRRVKCSEECPSCQHCQDYRVLCSYDGVSTDFVSFGEQVSREISVVIHQRDFRRPPCPNPVLKTHMDDAVMYRFRNRTVYTFGTPETAQLYVSTVPRLAVQYEYLRHTIYAITLVHDRAINALKKPSATEAYYLRQAAKVFNEKLSVRVYESGEEDDALWATAVYLCAVSTATIDCDDPVQAWPIDPKYDANLNWLNMQRGLRTLWTLTQMGDRCTSLSSVEKKGKFNCAIPDIPEPGVEGVPDLLKALYKLDESSTPDNHTYHAAVRYLTILLPIKSTPPNTLKFMIFAGGMRSEFQALLQQKDPLALLLMALWYTKLLKTHWFVSRRATVECRSIYEYLKYQTQGNNNFIKVMSILNEACLNPEFDIADHLFEDTGTYEIVKKPYQMDAPSSCKVDMFWL